MTDHRCCRPPPWPRRSARWSRCAPSIWRSAGRGPRPARRQRRRQVDAGQDPHRRAPRRRRHDRRPRRAGHAPPAERRPWRGAWRPVFQDPALVPDLTVAENLRLTGADVGAVRQQLAAMDLDGLDLDEQVRDVPLPFLRMLDLARALSFDPQLLMLDEITAALPPDLSERVFAVMRRWKAAQPVGAVHLPPAGRGARALRHVHRAARRPRRRLVRAGRGRRGADRGRRCSARRRRSVSRGGARRVPRRLGDRASGRCSRPSTSAPAGSCDDVSPRRPAG